MLFRQNRRNSGLISYAKATAHSNGKQHKWHLSAFTLSLALNVALLIAMLYQLLHTSQLAVQDAPARPKETASSQGRLEVLDELHRDVKSISSTLSTASRSAAGSLGSHLVGDSQATEVNRQRPHGDHPPYWLTIGIPTVPRKVSTTNYLTTTLESLMDELPGSNSDGLWGRVRVLVMNNTPGRHPEFEALRRRAQAVMPGDHHASKMAAYVDFVDNPGTVTDPAPDLPDPDDLNNPGDRPGRQVRKQTCDLITLLRLAQPLSTYYLFMEDDFRVCPYALRALQYALTKATSLPHLREWIALRASYGMNGVLMPAQELPRLIEFLWQYITKKPPDLLWVEFLARQPNTLFSRYEEYASGPTDRAMKEVPTSRRRPFVVYKYNLMSHLGTVSSFDVRPDRPEWPGCYESMTKVWSLQMYERFPKRCKYTDVAPCQYSLQQSKVGEAWLHQPLDWALASQQQQQQPKSQLRQQQQQQQPES